jgi:hypothetical protein
MRSIKNWLVAGAFSIMILGIPAVASAQYGQNDRYGRNAGYGNYGDMRSVIRSLKTKTRIFERQLDRDLDNSRMDGTRREDRIMDLARDFRSAVNRLNSTSYGRRDNNVEHVLQLGSQLERSIGRSGMSYNSRTLWSGIRNDLQMLGNGYGYNTRNNRGNRNGGGWGNNAPSWWPY